VEASWVEGEATREQEQAVDRESGWYKDPYFLKRERFWDNGWTDQIRAAQELTQTGNVETVLDATSPAVIEAPVLHDDDTLVVRAAYRDTDTAVVPVVSHDTVVLPAVSEDGAEATSLLRTGGSENEAATVRARSRRRRRGFVGAALVVVALVAVAAVLATSGSGHGSPGGAAADGANSRSIQPAARGSGTSTGPNASTNVSTDSSTSAADTLAAAAAKSVRKQTVALTFALTPMEPGQSTPQGLSGDGAFSLDSGLGDLSVKVATPPPQDVQLILEGNTVYLHVTDSPVAGKSWVVASTDDLPALGPGSSVTNLVALVGNPGMLVQQLAADSYAVASLGHSTVEGKQVERYAVNFSSSPTTTSAAGWGTHNSEVVDVGAHKLVRQIVIPAPPVDVHGQQVRMDVVISFSHYRGLLSVATPPASQLLGLSQYLTGLAAASDASAAPSNPASD
jgi:hypothetical protein